MNSFLINMINRHQDRVEKVQPRIRSMFEPEPGGDFSGGHFFADTEKVASNELPEATIANHELSDKPAIMESSFHGYQRDTTPPVSQEQPAEHGRDPGNFDLPSFSKEPFDSINEKINDVLDRLDENSESTRSFSDLNRYQRSISFKAADKTATAKPMPDETGLTHRIEETLKRLNYPRDFKEKSKSGLEGHGKVLPDNFAISKDDPFEPIISQPLKNAGELAEPPIKIIKQKVQETHNPKKDQVGSLQVPAWVTGMQTDLNSRWRKINAESQAEPVINVTIGRVEVRAVNTAPENPTPVRKKNTGVMSLEDYLKQRENKGRT
jgi:hypothetical protein